MAKAKNNPNSATWLIAGGLLAAGALWWTNKKKTEEADAEFELDLEMPDESGFLDPEAVEVETFEAEEGWVEDVPTLEAALPSTPEAAAPVLADPDPSPTKERKKFQASIKLTKAKMKKGKGPDPKNYKWKAKKVANGVMVVAISKKSGGVARYLVSKRGQVTRIKPRPTARVSATSIVRRLPSGQVVRLSPHSVASMPPRTKVEATRGLPAAVRKLIL